ncbi:MAG: sulfatase-like hydrolase/transferase [Chitinivibrionales bacterium]|nr:sulfatase-like hydrolase/transferase [Chitinivibrionales bacterium]
MDRLSDRIDQSRRNFLRTATAAGALSCMAPGALNAFAGGSVKPNIILIMTDDQGYGDLGCYGSQRLNTPNIDTMADEGVRFTDFYSAAAVCTPARMGLLTGCYPARVGWEGWVLGHHISTDKGLNPDEVTIAEVLKTAGYATTCIGKWHVGEQQPFLPANQGFDSYYGILKSNDQATKLYRDTTVIEDPYDQRYLTSNFTDEAVTYIQDNKDRPFFLYLPHTAPHFPLKPHPDWEGKSDAGAYGDIVEQVDWSVGRILAALKQHNIDDNTLVIFTSDNGPRGLPEGTSYPLRGKKWESREGGVRMPCVMRWPGTIPAGRTSDDIISMMDLLPTCAHIAGVSLDSVLPAQNTIDGINQWDVIRGAPSPANRREEILYWDGYGEFAAIRSGKWKYSVSGALHDLSEDINESQNLASQNQAVVDELSARATALHGEVTGSVRPMGDVNLHNWDTSTQLINRLRSTGFLPRSRAAGSRTFDLTGRNTGAGNTGPFGIKINSEENHVKKRLEF